MELVARQLELAISICAVGGMALRLARRATGRVELRLIAAFVVAAFAAAGEVLILGLFGIGENGNALLLASVVLWAVVHRLVAASGPTVLQQTRSALHGLVAADAIGLGALVTAVGAGLVEALVRPYTAFDGLRYQLMQPLLWLTDGHPGSLHVVSLQIPLQAYPKNTELLLGWMLGLSHSFYIGTILMYVFLVVATIAFVAVLARLGVPRRLGVLVVAAVMTLPVAALQVAGASSDLATLCWIVCTGALVLGALEEISLLPFAFLSGGMALGTKASAAVPVAIMLILGLWAVRGRLRATARLPLVAAAVGGSAIGALWYVQDWVVYGAPLYPFSRVPSGPQLPLSITAFNTSFLEHPRLAIRAGTVHGYLKWFGAGPLLVLAAVGAAVFIVRLRGTERRLLVGAYAAALLALLVWSAGPFTGYPGVVGTTWYPLDGTRYLLPSMPIVLLPVALLMRRPGLIRWVVVVALFGAVALNLYELRHWAPPERPSAAVVIAGAVLGALAAAALEYWRRLARGPRVLGIAGGGAVLAGGVVVITGLLSWTASGYVVREADQHPPVLNDVYDVQVVINWLDHQPSWVKGNAPVATGPQLDALLAGPRLSHRISLIPQTDSCNRVRTIQATHWIVITKPLITSGAYSFATYTRATCLHGAPAFSTGGYLIYRPAI